MITDAQMKFMLVGVNANPKMMADTYTDFFNLHVSKWSFLKVLLLWNFPSLSFSRFPSPRDQHPDISNSQILVIFYS